MGMGFMKPRTHVYVDGFNLYYGLLKDSPFKWLNLEKLFALLRPHDQVLKVLYFTAMIDGSRLGNQEDYIRAIKTLPSVEIIFGKLMKRNVVCKVPGCNYQGSRIFTTAEEKGTDVHIAVRMLDDAFNDRCDNFILVSGDSDLAPVILKIKSLYPSKMMIVYVPARSPNPWLRHSKPLANIADKYRFFPEILLSKAQFPDVIRDSEGEFHKPASW
jgi:6-hydroxy-3-succinoylpyridine 3-monooxygenase